MKIPFIHMFNSPLHHYFYDVNTNRIIRVDERVYHYLKALLESGVPEKQNAPPEVGRLKEEGLLSSNKPQKIVHPFSEFLAYQLGNNIMQMTLQLTKQCNFRCVYCVYDEKSEGKQRLHEGAHMSWETAKSAVDFFWEHSRDAEDPAIGFYGGEPLLAFGLLQKIIEYADRIFSYKKIRYVMTTNGSLLTEEMIDYLVLHKVKITFSLDGPKEVHDSARKFAFGNHSAHDAAMKNIEYIVRKYPDYKSIISFNSVINFQHDYNQILDFFEQETYKDVLATQTLVDDSFCPGLYPMTDQYAVPSEIHKFKDLMCRYGQLSVGSVSPIVSQKFEIEYDMFLKKMKPATKLADEIAPGGPCIPGQKRLFVDTGGSFFPCERVSETTPAMCLGNIQEGFNFEKARNLLNVGALTEEKCKDCWAIRQCGLCAKHCDDGNDLSAEEKRSYCDGVRNRAEDQFRLYVLMNEMKQRFGKAKKNEERGA